MVNLIFGIVALALIYMALNVIRAADPKLLARLVRRIGGVLALAFAGWIGLRGEFVVAIPLGLFGLGLLGYAPLGEQIASRFGWGGAGVRSDGQQSQIRSQFIELTLDRRTGALDGRVIAGPEAGRVLGEFALADLLRLARGFDEQSRALLEGYLDRRFPGWRENAQDAAAGGGARQHRGMAASGKMTAEEAYQILGLQRGAGRDEISRAHRGLMKKLHPDQGGSTYLAARVNEAKDTLLRTHQH
jgi:hypothetical protein